MVARPTAPPLTVEHYKNLPETGPRYQLIDGDLYMAPAPNRFHQEISRNLEFLLMKYLEKHPVGVLYHAPFDVYLRNGCFSAGHFDRHERASTYPDGSRR